MYVEAKQRLKKNSSCFKKTTYVFIKGKFRHFLDLIKTDKYKEATELIVQLLEAPQLISMKFRQYVILQIADLLPKVNYCFCFCNFFRPAKSFFFSLL